MVDKATVVDVIFQSASCSTAAIAVLGDMENGLAM
jgi:hypothetical protein